MPSTEPELLYVNSKIVEPSKLSPELFTSWYNDVHIPDIFKTIGIQEAFRYYTTAEDPSSIERPYLALYPIKSKGFLQSAEFRSIPVQSDMLPGPSHDIFDVADFDTRYYTLKSNARPFDGPFLLTVEFEGEVDDRALRVGDFDRGLQHDLPKDLVSTASYNCYFSRQNRKAPEESELGAPPTNLALIWNRTENELESTAQLMSSVGKITKFKLLKDFKADK